ncbi:MAG: hypothetical protein WKF77_14825 [Planctomycetaceae bacterium]
MTNSHQISNGTLLHSTPPDAVGNGEKRGERFISVNSLVENIAAEVRPVRDE